MTANTIPVFLFQTVNFYTQIKKTVNTENIPGMCVLTNHTRDLVTAENEWVLSHGIELFRKIFTSLSYRNCKCYSLLSESPTHYASENRFERFCRIKFFDKPTQRSVFPTFQIKPTQATVKTAMFSLQIRPLTAQLIQFI